MEEDSKTKGLESLLAARRSLQASLDRSRALASALERAGPRIDEIQQRLPSLEAAVRPIRARREALASAAGHIDRAVGPAAAVLKVFDAVHGLEHSLLADPGTDLPSYLSLLQRLEEALRFLSDNCSLAVQWLDDIVDYLSDHLLADSRFISLLKSSLESLKSSSAPLDGGLLIAALDRLEGEFRRLLVDHSFPIPMTTSGDENAIAPSPLPVQVIAKLQAILERMKANSRLNRCVAIYVEVRVSNVQASLRALNLDYLEITQTEFDHVQSIQADIEKWGRHLEFSVKHLFEAEYKLCADVLERAGPPELWTGCFGEIAAQTGILAFLRFGRTVTESKKDPIKLLKLLDIFNSLNKLRLDFNRLFGGKACADIQNQTRDLIKRVINGACEIFGELLVQVELQRTNPPPSDGGVPRLVSFITNYCNTLLGEDYRPILTLVLVIQRSWEQKKFQDSLLVDAILNIMKAVEANFENWSKLYEDATLSNLFMMNTHWHFFKNLKGTKLGELLGDTWLREHEQYKDYYANFFFRESWGKLPSLLSRDGLILLSGGGRATARDLVKKRLKAFNEMFDDMYQKQSSWVISDNDLRVKTCQVIIQAIVPIYRSYMQNYGPLVEQDASASKYVKYTVEGVEKMLGSLFQLRLERSMSLKPRQTNGKVSPAMINKCHTMPTVM
ncbi:exocyst complex component EXO70A1 [Phalaenopsis equestris]|uniref:exocyst complex component EXO70A1 n=1 Tax=Phalaenopsis equestris TaxID=78828 RepID=UPI0009E3B8F6|nr:exocyst complex component EXO70A1 [Phalaenopsis equestris]